MEKKKVRVSFMKKVAAKVEAVNMDAGIHTATLLVAANLDLCRKT